MAERSLSFLYALQRDWQTVPSGNRVVAGAAEGMTAEYAAQRKPRTLERAVLLQCLKGILRAGWGEAAAARLIG